MGSTPNEAVAAAVERLTDLIGRDAVTVDADHQVYLYYPTVLTGVVDAATPR